MDSTTKTFVTDINLVPQTNKAKKDRNAGYDTCICCAKPFKGVAPLMVMTDLDGMMVGPECAKKCIAAGFEVEANWA